MAMLDHILDSEGESEDELVGTPERNKREPSQAHSALSHRFRDSPQKPRERRTRQSASADDSIAVMVPAPARPWEYKAWQGDVTVDAVLEEIEGSDGQLGYRIEYEDGNQEDISFDKLITLRNGRNALDLFTGGDDENKSSSSVIEPQRTRAKPSMSLTSGKRVRRKTTNQGYMNTSKTVIDSDEEEIPFEALTTVKKRRLDKGRVSLLTENSTRETSRVNSARGSPQTYRAIDDEDDEDEDEGEVEGSDDEAPRLRRGAKTSRGGALGTRASTRVTRSAARPLTKLVNRSANKGVEDDDDDELSRIEVEEEEASEVSDIFYDQRKSKRKKPQNGTAKTRTNGKRSISRPKTMDSASEEGLEQPTRRSGRERNNKSMKELDMDEEIYADEVAKTNTPKVISIREVFQPISAQSRFRIFHSNDCDVCRGTGTNSNKGTSPLIHCQGCSTSIHKVCLGYRSGRDHMVTKVGPENFVMQCRRCISKATKDPFAPRLDVCQSCKKPGVSCAAFSGKQASKVEEKLRMENGGEDPITKVLPNLINNPDNLLFRCTRCRRGFHFEHLPKLTHKSKTPGDINDLRNARLREYTPGWECKDCYDYPDKPVGLVAWRPADQDSYNEDQIILDFNEDEREYLVKWENKSYLHCTWMSGNWVWGVTAVTMRKAFIGTEKNPGVNDNPIFTTEEAIPEEFCRIEIVFDVEYDDSFVPKSEKSDKVRAESVVKALVKFEGLGYEEAVWDDRPSKEDADRWTSFVNAYHEYVAGKYFKQISASVMQERIQGFRGLNYRKFQYKDQPSMLIGGELMPYQKEGMNWMLYNYHQKKNAILADEMGLGKTIQVIAMITALVKDNPKCWPFLIVTPNSTCPNWRREMKRWAPSLRVVAFYGSQAARDMAMKYELYPDDCTDLRAHVVITSYETPIGDPLFFRKIKWAGLIVDEGQRLKNDKNLLYRALLDLKISFQILLTGTPLQNNKRELFNLLQFLEASNNAEELDAEYETLTEDNLPKLHELIRPYFLRRTKLQVLKELPTIAQMILPVSMSVVQKKLYKSILEKNPTLIKSIFAKNQNNIKAADRHSLNNILMQLRKCLCHPFVYNSQIEEKNLPEEKLHRNLIDAASKFQLLEIMLPKLKAAGHRVLIFSQFLDQLDNIEDLLRGLDIDYRRLDGKISAQEKQKRIDEFNVKDSKVSVFLLSTRSGGVGINLATADTVIILDPDFNPQQDIQAISRAHRIGQKNKVLVFQFMTKDTVEEKIIQIGRKKIALGAIIGNIGKKNDAPIDLTSILKHGTAALFNDDDTNDIIYDSASVDMLLDRAKIESSKEEEDNNPLTQFSLARVWASDKGTLEEDTADPDAESATPSISVWDEILKRREEDAAREAAQNMQAFGRGKRARQAINYQKSNMDVDDDVPGSSQPNRRRSAESVSDEEFAAGNESDVDVYSESEAVDPRELEMGNGRSKVDGQAGPPTQTRIVPPPPAYQQHSLKYGDKPQKGKPGIENPPAPKSQSQFQSQQPQQNYPEYASQFRPPTRGPFQPGIPPFNPPSNNTYQATLNSFPQAQQQTFRLDRPPFQPINPNQHHMPPPPNPLQGFQPHQPYPPFISPYQEVQAAPSQRFQPHPHPSFGIVGNQNSSQPVPIVCNLCGHAHIGLRHNCPTFDSVKEVRLQMDALAKQFLSGRPEIARARGDLALKFCKSRLKEILALKKPKKKDHNASNGSSAENGAESGTEKVEDGA